MHPNVKRGNIVHQQHFEALAKSNWTAPGWEVYSCNQQIGDTALRPDWIIINYAEKRAYIIDVTTKYSPPHYQKGLKYVGALADALEDPSFEIVYVEDYWLNAVTH